MHEIGQEIRRLRDERGWSQAKLAVTAGIGVSAVSLIESGKRNPSATTLAKLAAALNVEVADFFPRGQPQLPLDPSLRDALPEEWRLRLLEPLGPAATAINGLFEPKVDAGDFTVEEYEWAGGAFEPIYAAVANAMSNEFIRGRGEAASAAEQAAFIRAWKASDDLRQTLDRAYMVLKERGVTDISEYRNARSA
jgi:transcriptional regulator with XRE-family HTH domain